MLNYFQGVLHETTVVLMNNKLWLTQKHYAKCVRRIKSGIDLPIFNVAS